MYVSRGGGEWGQDGGGAEINCDEQKGRTATAGKEDWCPKLSKNQ